MGDLLNNVCLFPGILCRLFRSLYRLRDGLFCSPGCHFPLFVMCASRQPRVSLSWCFSFLVFLFLRVSLSWCFFFFFYRAIGLPALSSVCLSTLRLSIHSPFIHPPCFYSSAKFGGSGISISLVHRPLCRMLSGLPFALTPASSPAPDFLQPPSKQTR